MSTALARLRAKKAGSSAGATPSQDASSSITAIGDDDAQRRRIELKKARENGMLCDSYLYSCS